jgi:hypothetical protein
MNIELAIVGEEKGCKGRSPTFTCETWNVSAENRLPRDAAVHMNRKPTLYIQSVLRCTDPPVSALVTKGQFHRMPVITNNKLRGLSLRANYIDRMTAACRRS